MGATMRSQAPTYEHIRMTIPAREHIRMTIPAREALIDAGNQVERESPPDPGAPLWRVTLTGQIPADMVAVAIALDAHHGYEQQVCLRLASEPEYPGEGSTEISMWERAALTVGCPHRECVRALVWAEAGRVPGYRVCTAGHHAQLDGTCETARAVRV